MSLSRLTKFTDVARELNVVVDQVNTNESSISTNTSNISTLLAGTATTTTNIGAVAAGTTVVEYGDGKRHVTILTVDTTLGAIAGGADLGLGKLIYTLPSGVIAVHNAYMTMALDESDGNVTADTPDVGVGTTVASGVVAVLSGTPAFENILTGQTAADCNNTATVKTVVDQPLAIETGDAHAVYFNVADTWAASGEAACAIVGTIVIEWSILA